MTTNILNVSVCERVNIMYLVLGLGLARDKCLKFTKINVSQGAR